MMLLLAFMYIVSQVYCFVKVTVSEGTLVGSKTKTNNGFEYYEYLQIPYAKPPTGNLRFKGPQPPEPWDGERNSRVADYEHICIQYGIDNRLRGSENCLYLSIYAPISASNTNLKPVLVYIHGGGYSFGNGIIKQDNGPDLLIERDIIVVFINYRLGVFGFLSLDIPEAAGNMGLKDQVMALKWIRENIRNFGGDRDRITIAGISAGAASVEYLMLSPLSKGLFNKAIIQSGSSLNHWAINYNIRDLGISLAKELGYKALANNSRAIYEHLFEEDAIAVLNASLRVSNKAEGLFFGFVPTIEKDFGTGDTFLSEYPYNLLEDGRFHEVPVIKGICEHEGYIMVTGIVSDQEQSAIDFFGDFEFKSGILTSSKLMASKGIPVYVYEFSYDGNMNAIKILFNINRKGAAHADDTAYIISMSNVSDVNVTRDDKLISKRMTNMWTNFVKTGNPTPIINDILPIVWPAYDIHEQKYLVINDYLHVRSDYEPEKMAIFESIYAKYHR